VSEATPPVKGEQPSPRQEFAAPPWHGRPARGQQGMEQAQLFETADERSCTPMFGDAHRRQSACIGGSLPKSFTGETPVPH